LKAYFILLLKILHFIERWDGHGYPDGLRADDIPLGARIIALVDAFDAMITTRPYQGARTVAQAKDEIWRCAGTQFDRSLADQFCTLLEVKLSMPIRPRIGEAVKRRTTCAESCPVS
jgi:HD-GYP domain-containing protein (c-di-GMP phosphodiesterase class II)